VAGVPPVMEGPEFSLDREYAIGYHYHLPRPAVVCIIVFVPEEHGKI
jgi:hypothetical protein